MAKQDDEKSCLAKKKKKTFSILLYYQRGIQSTATRLLLFYTGVFLVLLVFFSGVNALAWNSITTASILGNSLKWLDTLFFLTITAK